MYQCPQCQDLSLSNSSTLFMTLDGTTTCPTCRTTLRIKRKPKNYLLIAYMCLRAIVGSALPGGYNVGILIELSVMTALFMVQFLLMEYEVVALGTSREFSKI
jgi:hypothetical protein